MSDDTLHRIEEELAAATDGVDRADVLRRIRALPEISERLAGIIEETGEDAERTQKPRP